MYWSAGGGGGSGARPAATVTTSASAAPTTPEAAPTKAGATKRGTPARGGGGTRYFREPGFPQVAAYANRISYLMGEGRPAAEIGLYLPSSSFWLGSPQQALDVDNQVRALGHALLEHQRDFDYVDEQALTSVLRPEGDRLVNASGQGYRAIIVPPALAISRAALDRLQAFAKSGGRVIFIGPPPASVVERSFLEARGPADVSWATLRETEVAITSAVLAKLPTPDLALEQANALVSYTHRRLRDADVYFIFNSGDEKLATNVTLAGKGAVQIWDADTGMIRSVDNASAGATATRGGVRVPLSLEPWSTTLLVVGGGARLASNP
jgi:hypothetical protein